MITETALETPASRTSQMAQQQRQSLFLTDRTVGTLGLVYNPLMLVTRWRHRTWTDSFHHILPFLASLSFLLLPIYAESFYRKRRVALILSWKAVWLAFPSARRQVRLNEVPTSSWFGDFVTACIGKVPDRVARLICKPAE
jgi:hypothetical protein